MTRRDGAVKSVVFGTCLLNGKHALGSPEARECPLLKKAARAQTRQSARK